MLVIDVYGIFDVSIYILILLAAAYLVYKLAKFLMKVNRFIDEQIERQKRQDNPTRS
jgi:hypothetical protein